MLAAYRTEKRGTVCCYRRPNAPAKTAPVIAHRLSSRAGHFWSR